MKETKVVSAFPACGKTYCFKNKEEGVVILDSDSSEFSWTEYPLINKDYMQGKKSIKFRNPDFPNNYIEHIKENIGKADYIFVSTHEEVRKALKDVGIKYCLVFPESSLKAEWVGRCFLRGSDERFCRLIADQWDEWILQMEEDVATNNCNHYRLSHGEYLSDVIEIFGKDLRL